MKAMGSKTFVEGMENIFKEPVPTTIIKKIIPARLDGRNDEDIRFHMDIIDSQIRDGNVLVNKSKVKTIRNKKYGGLGIRYFGFYVELRNPILMVHDR